MSSLAKCGLCHVSESRYTCPRCQVVYCSTACYKSDAHIQCSEDFFRNCVLEQLQRQQKSQQHDRQERQNMEEILKKIERMDDEEEIVDSDDSDTADQDLEERLKHVNLDAPEEVWACLTEEERKDFEELVASGQITKCLPEWNPWWVSDSQSLIEEIDSEKDKQSSRIPQIEKEIPSLSELMVKKPSETVIFGLVNVMFSYACSSRLFLHDWETTNAKSAIETLVTISENLSNGLNFNSDVEAMEHAQITACNRANVSTEITALAKKDVSLILKRPSYVMAALSDIHRLLGKGSDISGLSKRLMFRAMKKVEFYQSYVKEYGVETLNCK